MSAGPAERPEVAGAAITRGVLFFAFWLAISGWKAADLPVGLAAVAGATWTSLGPAAAARRAHPAWRARGLAASFFRGSLVSGIRRGETRACVRSSICVLDSSTAPVALAAGKRPQRVFRAREPLCPEPCRRAWTKRSLLIHGLDVAQPIAQDLAQEEASSCGRSAMNDLLLAAAGFILITVAVGLARVLRGPATSIA